MSDVVSTILQWINEHPNLAGLATFIISAAESVAIIGTIVPGSVMMTAIGALAGAGVMPLWSTIIWAILGAIVGDGISYWIGHYFKDRLHDVWPFRKHPHILESGERFFRKHGGKSVFIGRFVGPVRALVPLIAGMLGMTPLRFYIANIASAIGWAPAYMLPGIALGAASLELPPDIAVHALFVLLMICLFVVLCLWMIKKSFVLISHKMNEGLNTLWWSLRKSKYFAPIAITLRHHNPAKTYSQLSMAFYCILLTIFLFYLASHVFYIGSQNIFVNNVFFHLFRSLRTSVGDTIFILITFLGESVIVLPVFVVAIGYLIWTRKFYTALHVFLFALLLVVGKELLKNLIHSPRPWGIFHSPSGFSFPSGHTVLATGFYLGFAYLLVKVFKFRFPKIIFGVAWIIILLVATSRMYLGAHWFTDVLGGLTFGALALLLTIISYNRHSQKLKSAKTLVGLIVVAMIVSYSFSYFKNFTRLKKNYTMIDWPMYFISFDHWWNQQGPNRPLYRINRFGLSTQILSLQWLADLDKIKKQLLENGWEEPEPRDWISVLYRVSDINSTEHLPLVSPLYLDKHPVLVLVKHPNGDKKLMVLRLWPSNVIIKNIPEALWVGTVDEVPRTYSWIIHSAKEISVTPELIFSEKPKNEELKTVMVQKNHRRHVLTPILLINSHFARGPHD